MASKDEVLGKLLQGDRKAAVELIRAEALAKGEAASLADQILLARMSGDLAGAVELALRWIEEEPEDVMPVLSLAETFLLGRELPTALTVLEQARLVDGDHPMYFRLVCLAATAAGAFTAAHGAAFCAWMQRLPELILRDLRAQAVCRSLEDFSGAYPQRRTPTLAGCTCSESRGIRRNARSGWRGTRSTAPSGSTTRICWSRPWRRVSQEAACAGRTSPRRRRSSRSACASSPTWMSRSARSSRGCVPPGRGSTCPRR